MRVRLHHRPVTVRSTARQHTATVDLHDCTLTTRLSFNMAPTSFTARSCGLNARIFTLQRRTASAVNSPCCQPTFSASAKSARGEACTAKALFGLGAPAATGGIYDVTVKVCCPFTLPRCARLYERPCPASGPQLPKAQHKGRTAAMHPRRVPHHSTQHKLPQSRRPTVPSNPTNLTSALARLSRYRLV